MKETLENILLSQSPALFLAGILLIISYFIRRRNHRIRAVLDLILAILSIAAGVALYFLGINSGLFTIKNFWQVRTAGYVGMGIVALLFLFLLFRAVKNAVAHHREVRAANRREDARKKELEEVRQKAYADGMADAKATEQTIEKSMPAAGLAPDAPADEPKTDAEADSTNP